MLDLGNKVVEEGFRADGSSMGANLEDEPAAFDGAPPKIPRTSFFNKAGAASEARTRFLQLA